jgi:hypothetical protein
MDAAWIIDFINMLEQSAGKPIKINFEGKEVVVEIGKEVVDFIQKNLDSLLNIGKDTFKEALLLMSEDRDFDARVKIYEQLDNDELIDKYKADTIQLAEIAERIQVSKDFWFALCKQVGTKVVFAALGYLL